MLQGQAISGCCSILQYHYDKLEGFVQLSIRLRAALERLVMNVPGLVTRHACIFAMAYDRLILALMPLCYNGLSLEKSDCDPEDQVVHDK